MEKSKHSRFVARVLAVAMLGLSLATISGAKADTVYKYADGDWLVGANTIGFDLNANEIDFFEFSLSETSNVYWYFDRTTAELDLEYYLYALDGGPDALGPYAPVSSVNSLTYLTYQDDDHDDSLGGDYEDPHGTHLLGPGTYVLALAEYDTLEDDIGGVSGGYTFEYEVSVVPLPPSAILFGTALLGLAGLKRAKRKA